MSQRETEPELRPDGSCPPGRVIGRYEIVRELATGGMAVVYEARHLDLGRRVAIKVMRASFASDATQVQRFVLEARAASRFSHPHIIAVTDVDVDGDLPFMVMEYLDGEDLAATLSSRGPMSLAGVADLALPVISAVAAAHAEGIVHRDLKPENIFLARRGHGRTEPVLLDFGIARTIARSGPSLTRAGFAIGTPSYMSPEQLTAASDVDERADQYALGVILYQAVTGRLPFDADGPFQMAAAITRGATPPSSHGPALPREFDALVVRALSAERADRFANVRDLGRALWPFTSALAKVQWAEEFGERVDRVPRAPSPSVIPSSSHPMTAAMTIALPGQLGPVPARVLPETLRRLPAFEECSLEALRALVEVSGTYRFPPGATIVRQGAHGHGCYLVLSGEVDVVKETETRRWVLARLPAGCSFGQIALVDNLPRTASVVAATEAVVLEIGRDAFERMLSGTDEVGEALSVHLAIAGIRHLRRATKRLAELLGHQNGARSSKEATRALVYLQAAVQEWALPVEDGVISQG